MKILVLSNLYPPHYVGGYELYCRTAVESLREKGNTVEVLTSDHSVPGIAAESEPGVHRVLRIHGMFGHPWLGIGALRHLELHNNAMLRNQLQQLRPDVVYLWNCSGLSKSLLFTLQQSAVPYAICMCDHWIARCENADVWLRWWNREDPSLPHRLLRGFWTMTGYRARLQKLAPTNPVRDLWFPRIYFCSKALRTLTAEAGFPVEHGSVIHCLVDIERFKGAPRTSAQPLQKLLYVGRLAEDKGVMTALRALALIRNKFAGRLDIFGRGEPEYESKLKDFAEQQRLPVTFESGNASRMPSVYAAHDALVFTSEWQEPFALTPLEAMASGLPVIGTTTGGSAELFRHGENALTYTAGNAEELAQRILELDKNNLLRENIARVGYEEVRSRFARPVIIGQAENFLKETIATWRPRPLPAYAP